VSYYIEADEARQYFSQKEKDRLSNAIRAGVVVEVIEVAEIDYTWVMRDGTRVKVSKMRDSHLKNSLAMVMRTTKNAEQIKALSNEIARRMKVNKGRSR